MKLLVTLLLVACKNTPGDAQTSSVAIETYRAAGEVVGMSASGNAALVQKLDANHNRTDELQLIERQSGRMIAKASAIAVGDPDDTEAYGLVGTKLIAMASKREVALELAGTSDTIRWELAWSTVDHASGTALLAFHERGDVGATETDEARDLEASRYQLVEIDVKAMTVRGRDTISILGSKMPADEVARAFVTVETKNHTARRTYGSARRECAFAARLSQVYLTCLVPQVGDKTQWVVTRYDARKLAWSIQLETEPAVGDDLEAAVGGDGKTLLLVIGNRSYGLVEAKASVLVDTATGKSRTLQRAQDPLGKIATLGSVPNTPLVMQVHRYEPSAHGWGESSFHGVSVVDTTTGDSRVVFDTTETHEELRHKIPRDIVVLPNGTYLLAL